MNLLPMTFKITGLSAMLHNNPAKMRPADNSIKTKRIPSAEDEAASSAYKDTKGYYVPAIQFRMGILYAASGKKMGKRSAKSVLAAGVLIEQEKCYLSDPKTHKPIAEHTIDTRRCIVQRAGILRSRAKIEEWACEVTFLVDHDLLGNPEKDLLDILNDAGTISGVGDFRPQKMGWFGRYKAELKK